MDTIDVEDTPDNDRSYGVGGKNFQSNPSASKPKAPEKKREKSTLMASWMERVNVAVKEVSEGMGKAAQEAMSAKGMRKVKQQITELVKPQSKTVDQELIVMVEKVESTRHDMLVMASLIETLTKSMKRTAEDHLALSACFEQFIPTSEDAAPHLAFHQTIMDLYGKNGVGLIEALNFFKSKTEEYVEKNIGAARKQVQVYEDQRIEYDARRVHFESLKETESPKLPGAEAAFLEAYNKLSEVRTETWTELCTVERVKCEFFNKELGGLVNAVSMFNSGNQSGFEEAMSKMNERD